MTTNPSRRRWLTVLMRLQPVLIWLGVLALLTYPLLALGVRWDWWNYQLGLSLIAVMALMAVLLLALAGIGLLVALRTRSPGAINNGIWAVVLWGAPIFYLAYFGLQSSQLPMIHDISTDLVKPPQFQVLAGQRPEGSNSLQFDGAVADLQRQHYPDVQSLLFSQPVPEVIQAATGVAEDLGWNLVSVDPQQGRIEATDRTFWFGFTDDIVIRVTREQTQSKLDVRSVSRVGKSDLGKNAARIRAFSRLLKMQID